jgi:hypothetical protein
MRGDGVEHDVRLIEHRVVLEPEYAQAPPLKEARPRVVVIATVGSVMRRTVQLDDEALARAVEVDDIRADAVLSPEFAPVQPSGPQALPQSPLGKRLSAPQLPTPRLELFPVVEPLSIGHDSQEG